MSKSNDLENALLLLMFNNTNGPANMGDATGLRGSTTAGSFYVSLHTADPGEAGTATTSETTYTSYARQAVARSGAGWTVTANSVSPAANIVFPISTGGTPTITHFGIVSSSSGAGTLFYSGTVTPNIVVSTSVVQTLTTGSTITED
jgi:hypothetical protein